ncbi:hypothetical protein Ancab_036941 [Ancistrocladus abbreviatus]
MKYLKLLGFYGENASGMTDAERVAKVLQGSEALSVRFCVEIEGEYIHLLRTISNMPMISVGLFPPEEEISVESTDGRSRVKSNANRLDERTAKTVIFVGFGSECKLSKDQDHEIAYGLELSQLPFMWAFRQPDWAANDTDALPSGRSLFHSGWGSVIETLQYGHVLVVLPFIIDQGLNARMVVDKGLAIEVERTEDGSFSRVGIAKAVKRVMVEAEGEKTRICAKGSCCSFR